MFYSFTSIGSRSYFIICLESNKVSNDSKDMYNSEYRLNIRTYYYLYQLKRAVL